MRTTILLPLVLAACGGPVPIYWIDGRAEPSWDRIEDACDYWGLDCFEADDDRGALTVLLTDEGAIEEGIGFKACGRTFANDLCSPMVWSCPRPGDLEHEIGHAFGLKHYSDENNIMWKFDVTPDFDATNKQTNKVHRRADFLASCIGRK